MPLDWTFIRTGLHYLRGGAADSFYIAYRQEGKGVIVLSQGTIGLTGRGPTLTSAILDLHQKEHPNEQEKT